MKMMIKKLSINMEVDYKETVPIGILYCTVIYNWVRFLKPQSYIKPID